MPIRTWIEDGIIIRELSGEIVSQEIIDDCLHIPNHPDFQKNMHSLWDFRMASLASLTQSNLYAIKNGVSHSQNVKLRDTGIKIAYVVSRDLEYGISRMMEAMFISDQKVLRHTFRSLSEALEWVKEPLEDGWEVNV